MSMSVAPPVAIEVTRGSLVESRHQASLAVVVAVGWLVVAPWLGRQGTPTNADLLRVGLVVVGVLDVVGPYLQPALGKLDGVFQLGGPGNRAAPDGTDRAAHFHTGIITFLDTTLGLGPVIRQGRTGIGKMMFFLGGHHHQQAIGADPFFSQLDGPIHGTFPDGNGGKGDTIIINTFLAQRCLKRSLRTWASSSSASLN